METSQRPHRRRRFTAPLYSLPNEAQHRQPNTLYKSLNDILWVSKSGQTLFLYQVLKVYGNHITKDLWDFLGNEKFQ